MTTSYGAPVGVQQTDPELSTPLFIDLMSNLGVEAAAPDSVGAIDSIDLRDPDVVVVHRSADTAADNSASVSAPTGVADKTVTDPLEMVEDVDYLALAARAESLAPVLTEYPELSDDSRRDYAKLRRAWDLAFVFALGLVAAPLVALAAIALKLEDRSAPVFYRQFRTGHLGRRFRIVKLRSMVPNADALKAQLAEQNLRDGPDFKVVDDPRITRVGRFLRRTSIDELPQLWNVVTGEMTLVGPRPTSLNIGSYKSWQLERFDVKPGLTGLWQATARDSESWHDRLALDITYVRRACPSLDLWIVAKTIQVVLRGTGST